MSTVSGFDWFEGLKWKGAIRLSAMVVFRCKYLKLSGLGSVASLLLGYCAKTNTNYLLATVHPGWHSLVVLTDSLWSTDLFRCESATLKSHWVMVVIDQFTRRIIGFAVHPGDCDGIAYCRMFNQIIAGKSLPKYLSSDNDPLFLFHRWKQICGSLK